MQDQGASAPPYLLWLTRPLVTPASISEIGCEGHRHVLQMWYCALQRYVIAIGAYKVRPTSCNQLLPGLLCLYAKYGARPDTSPIECDSSEHPLTPHQLHSTCSRVQYF